MGSVALPLAIGATLLSAAGQAQAGQAAAAAGRSQQQAAEFVAAQQRQQAGQERAAAQRSAIQERRRANLVGSALQARAAASGAGALDPTVANLDAGIAGEGEYRSMLAMYNGEERARGLEMGADANIYQGQQYAAAGRARQQAANIGVMSTLLSGANSFYEKYGGGYRPIGAAEESQLIASGWGYR